MDEDKMEHDEFMELNSAGDEAQTEIENEMNEYQNICRNCQHEDWRTIMNYKCGFVCEQNDYTVRHHMIDGIIDGIMDCSAFKQILLSKIK